MKIKDDVIIWPDGDSKEDMKRTIMIEYGFQNYIGIIDGTIFILNENPTRYGESYYCRNNCYSLNVQVVCNHRARVVYYYGG